jgi:hypothetical protein
VTDLRVIGLSFIGSLLALVVWHGVPELLGRS